MEATTPPIIETLDRPRTREGSHRSLRRAAWIGLDAIAVAGFLAFAIQAIT
jgi:hypothetical protein